MRGRSTRPTARERTVRDGILAPTTAPTSLVRTATRDRTVQVSLTRQRSPWWDITSAQSAMNLLVIVTVQNTWTSTSRFRRRGKWENALNLQFALSAFNLLNHPNFGYPGGAPGSPVGSVNCGAAVGRLSITLAAPPITSSRLRVLVPISSSRSIIPNNDRELQYGLKITF